MLREFDAMSTFKRDDGKVPFLLLDGHGSRTELEFLKRINDLEHEWVACIGVPRGTSL